MKQTLADNSSDRDNRFRLRKKRSIGAIVPLTGGRQVVDNVASSGMMTAGARCAGARVE